LENIVVQPKPSEEYCTIGKNQLLLIFHTKQTDTNYSSQTIQAIQRKERSLYIIGRMGTTYSTTKPRVSIEGLYVDDPETAQHWDRVTE
jgi:hypothetical protein